MSLLPQSFVDDVRDDADIVDIVGRSVQLKKAGVDYIGLCPFHSEKSPSFTVSAVKQFYHCFGCGAHGNAINFLMEYQGMAFLDAVEKLAGEQGKKMPEREAPTAQESARQRHAANVLAALGMADNIFYANLREFPLAIEYYKKRGLTKETVMKFRLGYADNGIQRHMPNVATDVLVEAGLLTRNNDTGEVRDKFRRRVMFPIHNEKGAVIGFGGRVLNDDETPKYMNSPESCVFSKGDELYGLYFARAEIKRSRSALMVEGYMDVIGLHQSGEMRAVAALGTSATVHQITRLYRMCDEIIFCFDGDNAGIAASERAAKVVLSVIVDGKSARFVALPAEHDPDSYVRANGLDAWAQYLQANGVPLSKKITAIATANRDVSLPEDKSAIAVDCEAMLETMTHAPRFRSALKAHFEQFLGMPLKTLKMSEQKAAPSQSVDFFNEPSQQKNFSFSAEKHSFYQNYALLCSLAYELTPKVPTGLIDEFASLISGWFAVAPQSLNERFEQSKTIRLTPLRLLIRETLVRSQDRLLHVRAITPEQEKQAILDAILRDASRSQRASEAAALFE